MSPKTNKPKGVFFMKTVLLSLLFAVCLFAQGAPSANAYGLSPTFELDRIVGVAGFDTLSGADSTTLLASTVSLDPNWQYILRVGKTTGSGSDSVSIIVRQDFYHGTTLIYSVNVDTINTATGESIILPFARSDYSDKTGLKYISTEANGGVVILGHTSIIKRRYK